MPGRFLHLLGAWLACLVLANEVSARPCGEVVSLPGHGETEFRYVLAGPAAGSLTSGALVLLAGGNGVLDIDPEGCPRLLTGNFLVRSAPLFRAAGWVTALVDAPSDHRSADGLGAFRTTAGHADDLGRVIADLRRRGYQPVWIVGTSRGTISAANAAARLRDAAAPDGVVLTSIVTVGTPGGRKRWTEQTVFDVALDAIRVPALLVGHAQDRCLRSPAGGMPGVEARLGSARKQAITIAEGSGGGGPASLNDCEGRSPHGFYGQEAEAAAAMLRFIVVSAPPALR